MNVLLDFHPAGGDGGGKSPRSPQSLQSCPNGHSDDNEPGPPSWHAPFWW